MPQKEADNTVEVTATPLCRARILGSNQNIAKKTNMTGITKTAAPAIQQKNTSPEHKDDTVQIDYKRILTKSSLPFPCILKGSNSTHRD